MKHIMKYMKGTLDFKFCLEDKDIALRIFCDMDLAEDANNWESTTWYVFLIGAGVILWKCEEQLTIALFTTKAEFMVQVFTWTDERKKTLNFFKKAKQGEHETISF